MKSFIKMLGGILFYDKRLPYESTFRSAKELKGGGKLCAPLKLKKLKNQYWGALALISSYTAAQPATHQEK